ncbi:hypothetical protein TNCV_3133991 [Trichonephila clavipes]|nr:hypothetical protein TNCV_3133991 [Trichonephila clavipes]
MCHEIVPSTDEEPTRRGRRHVESVKSSNIMPLVWYLGEGDKAKTRNEVNLVPAHVTTVEGDLKQQPVYQDSPKGVLSDSGLGIELSSPQQSHLCEVEYYHPSE